MRAILYETVAKVELSKDELPELVRLIRREDLTFHGHKDEVLVFVVKNVPRYLGLGFMAAAQADRERQASFYESAR